MLDDLPDDDDDLMQGGVWMLFDESMRQFNQGDGRFVACAQLVQNITMELLHRGHGQDRDHPCQTGIESGFTVNTAEYLKKLSTPDFAGKTKVSKVINLTEVSAFHQAFKPLIYHVRAQ